MYDLIFYILAAICIGSGAVVAFSRNIAYAAFALLFTFFGVAGLYILLGADFVGVSRTADLCRGDSSPLPVRHDAHVEHRQVER